MNGEARLSIVVPAFQEALALPEVIRRLEAAARATELPFGIIVADDGSTANTWEVLKQASLQTPNLTALRLSLNFGKEGASPPASMRPLATHASCLTPTFSILPI